MGVMLESNLVAGRQDLVPGRALRYGQSITDACMNWETTDALLDRLALARARGMRGRAAIQSQSEHAQSAPP